MRAEAAFTSPDTLGDFVSFLRGQGARLDARAVVALIPRHAIAYPQVARATRKSAGVRRSSAAFRLRHDENPKAMHATGFA